MSRTCLSPRNSIPFPIKMQKLLGQPALLYLLRKLGPDHLKQGGPLSLTLQLPPDTVTPDLKARVEQALRRYCEVRIADDQAQLRIMRSNGLRSLPSAIMALGICLALSYLFLSNVLAFLSPAMNELLGQGFGIVSWVVLWHPVEAFLYDPIPLRREISVLNYLAATDITIEPQRA